MGNRSPKNRVRTGETVAVVGIGFAPKRSPEAARSPRKPRTAPAAQVARLALKRNEPPVASNEIPADSTDNAILAGGTGGKTVAVVGIGFAPKKSSSQ